MKYEESFKQHCVNLVVKEGRTKASVTKEFQLSQGIIKKWVAIYEANRTDKQADLVQNDKILSIIIQVTLKNGLFGRMIVLIRQLINRKD